jgi:hypothetical protein
VTTAQSVRTGLLFIAATAAVLVAHALAKVVALSVLFELVAAGASAGIAISLYPVLGAYGVGAVVFRSIEAVMYTVGAIALFDSSALALREHAILAGVFAFCAGAGMYYWALLRSRILPWWLAAWGLIGVALMFVACVLALSSGRPITSYVTLALPIAVQEMVLAVWLIASPGARRA